MTVHLTAEAEADIAEAHDWYSRRGQALGGAYLSAVEAAKESIRRRPEAFPVVHRQVRRVLLRRFPYLLFYLYTGNEIIVIGCFHAARDPRAWQERDRT